MTSKTGRFDDLELRDALKAPGVDESVYSQKGKITGSNMPGVHSKLYKQMREQRKTQQKGTNGTEESANKYDQIISRLEA